MIFIGFFSDTMVFSMVGFFLIFLLSFTLINSSLQINNGYNITEVGATTVVTPNYSLFTDGKQYGIYLGIASAVGMILTFIIRHGGKVDR